MIELDELKDEQDKALFMGLILGRVAECIKQRHRHTPGFRHLTLIEEAHRLLARPDPSEGGAKKAGVEMFSNLLAEVRKYGEGLIIADQIPNKLIPEVIKNTNIKIVHRLFAADDRRTMGEAMGLSDEQQGFLPSLLPGEAIVFCGGWHGAVRVQVDRLVNTNQAEIDEEKIRQRNQQQLWQHRQKLVPHLAQHPAIENAEQLALVLRHATPLTARWVDVVRSHQKMAESTSTPEYAKTFERHRSAFAKRYAAWQAAWPGADASPLPTLFFACWQDCDTTINLCDEHMAELKARLASTNPQGMLPSLCDSTEAFLAYVKAAIDADLKQVPVTQALLHLLEAFKAKN